jgi:N-acetylglucosaminyldiphosphoundecaprenol N-acetyl-beta-D-mannosaminyltransferase
MLKIEKKIKRLFDVAVSTMDRSQLMDKIDAIIAAHEKEILLPINTSTLQYLNNDKEYTKVLQEGNLVCADGMSIVWGGRLCGIGISERLATTDIVNYLFEHISVNNRPYKVFFLGGKEIVLRNAVAFFKAKYPKVNIVGFYSPPFMSLQEMRNGENRRIAKMTNDLGVDILFTGFGVPKQEKWCAENREQLSAPVLIPCGGMFGFYGGEYSRAPEWLQKTGFEWLFRLFQEPGRLWKRYLVSHSLFAWLLCKELAKKAVTGSRK